MFGNEFKDNKPVCPFCSVACEPDTGETSIVNTPVKGLLIMHKSCIETFNAAQSLNNERSHS